MTAANLANVLTFIVYPQNLFLDAIHWRLLQLAAPMSKGVTSTFVNMYAASSGPPT